MRIGVVAPSCTLDPALQPQLSTLAATHFPGVELVFDPQCTLSDGHFAGDDTARISAFVGMANDPDIDAIWFARGGYGSPTIFVDGDDMYFGNDQLPLVEAALKRTTA